MNILEIQEHLTNSEIIMSYRALTYVRNDKSNLSMYYHDSNVANGNLNIISQTLLIDQFLAVLIFNLILFKILIEEAWAERGITGGKEFTANSISYIIVGHTQHHINVTKDNYL